MIIYVTDRKITTNYNDLYASNLSHFPISKGHYSFLDHVAYEIEKAHSAGVILEVGSGQGDYLHLLRTKLNANCTDRMQFVGVDSSKVGIEQSSEKYPNFAWACDLNEAFIKRYNDFFAAPIAAVIDKTGTTGLKSQHEIDSFLSDLSHKMAPEAIYCYVANSSFYHSKLKPSFSSYDYGFIEGLESHFDTIRNLDDGSLISRIYRKRA